ncbi:MAG: glycosyltransferase family 2 protein [Chitinophagales bacterium]|nr:glycosyltransferase family 2 protein [Chitinophagales bacterium]
MLQKLSIIIPLYNEENTIVSILERILNVDLEDIRKEIIIVDDASTDNSTRLVQDFMKSNPNEDIQLISQNTNQGKGAALHRGITEATGEYLIIQDADLEYDPQDYHDLLIPVISGDADVVYGSRFVGSKPHRVLYFYHALGNKFLTFLCNLFCNLNLTDMETCYKVIHTKMAQSLHLKENRFGFEPEVTIKLSRIPNIRFYEIGISYYGRTYQEGKKINWRDGIKAIYCILRYGLFA